MPNYLHRTTKQYLQSVSPNGLLEDTANYISMPDLSAVQGISKRYWNIVGDVVNEMNQSEKDAVDSFVLSTRRDALADAVIDNLEGDLRQLIKLMIQEINILRAKHGLPDRTMAQFKTQIRNGYGS